MKMIMHIYDVDDLYTMHIIWMVMRMIKFELWVILITLIIMSIGCVNAIDTDSVDKISLEEIDSSTVGINDNSGSFNDLQNEIDNCQNNELKLKKNYTNSNGDHVDGIKITKDNIIIDGQGHTINGTGKSRIMHITGNNITLKSINFVNGFSNENGGAILCNGSNIKILYCNFVNNKASFAGAIMLDNTNGYILNSSFYYNQASNNGGAIYKCGEFENTIINSTYLYNSAKNGGAIYSIDLNSNIIDSNFMYNTAENNGIITYMGKKGNITGSSFQENTVSNGAICFVNLSNMSNNIFINNHGKYLIYSIKPIIIDYYEEILITPNGKLFNINNPTINITDNKGKTLIKIFTNETDNVVLKINNNIEYNVNITEGQGNIILNLTQGNYTLQTIFNYDETTICESENLKFQVPSNKLNPDLWIDAKNITVGENLTINISMNKTINGNVTIKINKNNWTVKIIKGQGSITIPNLEAGKYTIIASYAGSDVFNASEVNKTVEVKPKVVPVLIDPDLKISTKDISHFQKLV